MPSTMQILVNGTDVTLQMRPNSLSISDNLWARNTCSVRLKSDDGSWRPLVGHPITVYDTDGTTKLFAGSIDDLEETVIPGALIHEFTLHCVDPNQVCDRHLVVQAYVSPTQTLYDIVADVHATHLYEESISLSGVQTGPVIPETKIFNYKSVTQVFNELAQLTGYVWWVDYDRVLHFEPRGATVNTTSLTGDNAFSYSVTRSRAQGPYRNRQLVRAGTAKTSSRTETLKGDGSRRTFNTQFEIDSEPVVLVNGVAQTIGTLGLSTTKQFYWARGSNQISQDQTGTLITSADTISITYIGRYPSVVQAQLDEEITTRKAIEGGSGIYEQLKTDPNLNDVAATTALANAQLSLYGFIPDTLRVSTWTSGYRAGQLVTCTFPLIEVDGDYLVNNVQVRDENGQRFVYTVTLMNAVNL